VVSFESADNKPQYTMSVKAFTDGVYNLRLYTDKGIVHKQLVIAR
jgi:hypothetical protein